MQQEDQVKGCYRCDRFRYQACEPMLEGNMFVCHLSDKKYKINSRFDCESPGAVHLLSYVCRMHYVRSTFISFRTR